MADDIKPLKHRHLTTLSLQVDAKGPLQIGKVSGGRRMIVPVNGGTFAGERLNGTVLPGGADWVLFRDDGTMSIDVRLALKTDDDAYIYLSYTGRYVGDAAALASLSTGETLPSDSYSLAMSARFECGNERYAWLNNVIAVGTGGQTGFNPVYTIYEIG